ncbi:hypothetical protein H310_00986 [Aphanomyces invadans]|uniref:Uncharacterized protein n=1 Tax=Aphanomyces invadans TaxID=157072 RepID=A0A024UPS7_9STRA|nr:hypothetical protein H310_00986 [Aphanomyces invadans]ETW08396.1 hypothetical protein H310_00986 [Aphanomyces invadans]|eukprot:XP_008862201.1 hypothetical protein H310_00986 [Aphanomyces invadans]
MAENGQVLLPNVGIGHASIEDLAKLVKAKRELAQEKVISHQKVKLLREEIAECYMKNGVNHFVACKALREQYSALVKDPWLSMKPIRFEGQDDE